MRPPHSYPESARATEDGQPDAGSPDFRATASSELPKGKRTNRPKACSARLAIVSIRLNIGGGIETA